MTRKIWTASSNVARAQRANRTFRNRLALTTVLTAASFMGYGRQVEAACVAPPLSSSYSCSGASGAQIITANNAAVTTVAGFSVDTAVDNGITITGDGALSYIDTNASPITSTSDNGLDVRSTGDDGETKGSVTIATNGNIYGYEHGIYASNEGSGSIDIKVYGQITGLDGDGIYARNGYDTGNGVDLTITAGAQSVITSGRDGITAENYGSGKLEVIANGKVIADNDGIEAENSGIGTDLIVTTGAGSTITAGSDGIDAEHSGTGNLMITVNGKVTGGDRGIESDNDGNGYTSIFVGASGIVEGESAAINAESDGNQDIWITNDGIIRNVSGASDAIAIETYGGDTVLENNGTLTGVVRFNENDDDIGNFGLWNTAGGRNEFGWDTDEVYNRGTILAANDATVDETTEFLDLEEFDNDGGLISLADGGVGDILRMRGEIESEFEGPLEYDADNGYLAVDAVLGGGEAGESDVLEIIGNVDEDSTTTIVVNVVGVAGGANMLGIPVVKVIDGDTGPENFSLDGPVHAGLFAWDLRFDDEENWYELFTSGVGIGGYEMAAGLTGAQDIWHQTTGTLAQRQADLRPLLNGTQVTPVADFTEPVAPTAAGRVGPGFWFNAVGGWLDRDAETDGYTLDRKQSIYGGLAGFDFAAEGEGDTWLFGIFGGYLSSTLKFKETNSKWTYDGPTIGAYATYLNDAFYADMTVKADLLSIDIEQDDLGADDSDTDGINLGGRIDTGYKIGGGEGAFVEPQATLAVVNTDLDDAEVGGADVDFDSETSVKGRLGLKLGYDHTASNAMIFSSDLTASVWQEFNGSNNASIAAAGLGDFGVSDDTIETLGDISLGFSVTAQEGWSGFLRANYLFAEDFEAITGNAGLRYSW